MISWRMREGCGEDTGPRFEWSFDVDAHAVSLYWIKLGALRFISCLAST